MNISTQRTLFAEATRRISNAVIKGDVENPGYFVTLKTQGSQFSLTVNREDLVATAALDAELINTLKVSGQGEHSVGGELFIKMIMDTAVEGDASLEYLKTNSSYQAEEDDREFKGSIRGVLPGLVKNERCLLQCIKQASPPEIVPDMGTEVIIAGNKFASLLQKIGIASGKSTGDPSWTQVLVRANGENIDLATFNGLQLGWAQFNTDKAGELQARVPYDIMASVSSMLDKETPVCLYAPQDKEGPKGLIIRQDIRLGTIKVGVASYRLFAMQEKFPKFEKMVKQLSFRSTCKANLGNLKQTVRRLGVVGISRTKMVFSAAEKTIIFSKESSEASSEDIVLPLLHAEGSDVEMFISSRILKAAVDKCEDEEVEIKFTGASGLVLFTVSPDFKMFFQPFTQE